MMRFSYIAIIVWLAFGAVAGVAQQESEKLPDGKGKAELQKMCGGACHGLDVITSQRKSKQGWTNVVDTMVSRGAEGTDAEIELVIDYLAKNFGRDANRNL
jgi:hypothetical protein